VVSLLDKEKCGRPRLVDGKIRNLILELYWGRNIGLRKIARFVGVSTMTVWREVNESEPPASLTAGTASAGG
jgi:predicted transcriptional regulator